MHRCLQTGSKCLQAAYMTKDQYLQRRKTSQLRRLNTNHAVRRRAHAWAEIDPRWDTEGKWALWAEARGCQLLPGNVILHAAQDSWDKVWWEHPQRRGGRETGGPPTFPGRVQNGAATLQNTWAVPVKPISGITRRPGNYTFGHLSQKMEIYVHTEIWTGMFVSTLFVIARIWKQPNDLPHVDVEAVMRPGLGRLLCRRTERWRMQGWGRSPGADAEGKSLFQRDTSHMSPSVSHSLSNVRERRG